MQLTVFYRLFTDVEIFDCIHTGSLFIEVLDVRDISYPVKRVVIYQVSPNTFQRSDYWLCHVRVRIEQLGSHLMFA